MSDTFSWPDTSSGLADRARSHVAWLEYHEDRDGDYLASAYLWNGISRLLELEEPSNEERAILQFVATAGDDLRALLRVALLAWQTLDELDTLMRAPSNDHSPLHRELIRLFGDRTTNWRAIPEVIRAALGEKP
jgi:hypothetical protein